MSFILDAIAKSERERQQQEIPDARILATPVKAVQPPTRKLPYTIVAAVFMIVIVLLIFMQANRSDFNWLTQSKPDSIEPPETQIAASVNVDSVNETANTKIADSISALQQQVSEVVLETPTTVDAKISNPVAQISNTVALDELTPPPKLAKPTTNSNDNSPVVNAPNTRSGTIDSANLVNQKVILEVIEEPAPRKVFQLSELPLDVRRDLPSVSFSGHLFSKNVKVSYVLVNGGRSVIAGQQIVDEVFLHQVTPGGAIIDFRGYLIEIGVLQNWSLK